MEREKKKYTKGRKRNISMEENKNTVVEEREIKAQKEMKNTRMEEREINVQKEMKNTRMEDRET